MSYNVPVYSPGNCPDTLAWDYDLNTCFVECLGPYYPDGVQKGIFISTQVLGCISFALCYFYCFTALFRPIMLQFPNSNIFFMLFSFMIQMSAFLFPIFLGNEYVFCDTHTAFGQDNWACKLSGFILSILNFLKKMLFIYFLRITI